MRGEKRKLVSPGAVLLCTRGEHAHGCALRGMHAVCTRGVLILTALACDSAGTLSAYLDLAVNRSLRLRGGESPRPCISTTRFLHLSTGESPPHLASPLSAPSTPPLGPPCRPPPCISTIRFVHSSVGPCRPPPRIPIHFSHLSTGRSASSRSITRSNLPDPSAAPRGRDGETGPLTQ